MTISPYAIPGLKYRHASASGKDKIIQQICDKYDVSFEQLKSKTRERSIVFPRHLLLFLLVRKCGLTLMAAGKLLGRDHTTVLHAIEQVENYIETDSFGKRKEIVELY